MFQSFFQSSKLLRSFWRISVSEDESIARDMPVSAANNRKRDLTWSGRSFTNVYLLGTIWVRDRALWDTG